MTSVWACFAVRSAALCRVPVSLELYSVSGARTTFAYKIRFKSLDTTIAPSILQSSNNFSAVNRALILNPPSKIFAVRSSGESKTIIVPKFDRAKSSITPRSAVPGETNLIYSINFLPFSSFMGEKREHSIYNFMLKSK